MPSIISATTTSGLQTSADNSGNLQLQTQNGSNVITVPNTTGTVMVSGNMPAFSAYVGTTSSMTGGTFTKITYDTEEYDTNNCFASSRFTPTVAGYYQINGAATCQGTPVEVFASIYKNGSAYKYGVDNTTGGNSPVSSIVYLNGSTDYVEIYAYAASTKNTATGQLYTYFNGSLVRAA